ncbi:MAG: bifunctional demethylmenaquinone methyltransferase/2-methoxy-6-polyprenyl-1,4-benzoquinol methylase UbiE [Chlorobi bacterium]|nr:bifunctional demethylmenaquinone methyltransferase/2-methoxy-6-polyprenyl-1,4-benzoquinol methylase UbiE [Chlorobiota bacterium]
MKKTANGNPTGEILNNKGQHIGHMFDRIARRYDFLNHLLSMGIDRYWRRITIRELSGTSPEHVLDVATGTGDLAIALSRKLGCKVTGVDVSVNMMAYGEKKIARRKLTGKITFVKGVAEALAFDANTFDASTVAFGVRNFGDLEKGLKEILRVLKPGCPLAVLEFSMPRNRLLRGCYTFYLFHILPLAGKIISGDRQAYAYLPASIKTFPKGDDFAHIMQQVGYEDVWFRPLSYGIVTLYLGIKKIK